jgi:5-methylcytosine-specific restriction enzyme B
VYAFELMKSLNISYGDTRITYSTRSFKRLSIIIGQRYCFNYSTDVRQSWGCIQLNKIEPNKDISQETFEGSTEANFINSADFKGIKSRFIGVIQASKIELDRTSKSSYRTNNSSIFEKAIFDEEFRKQVFAVAFDNANIELKIPTQMNAETNFSLNQILYGPPGTGKTYYSINKALEIIGEKIEGRTRKDLKAIFDEKVKEGQIVFTTFHQSMSYEDFIEGLKPETDASGNISYPVQSGIFKTICQAAKTPNQTGFDSAYDKIKAELIDNEKINLKTPKGREFAISLNSNDNLTLYTGQSKEKQGTLTKENIQKQINGEDKFKGWEGYFNGVIEYLKTKYGYSTLPNSQNKNYVIIIDEINRGNVSQIFGELITLIEHDKRIGRGEAIEVKLPYSKESFGVPSNVHIIGTMNTADRSIEALDTALRRRFSFEEMPPCYDLQELEYEIISGITANQFLKIINNRIEKLLDKDHLIGHSFLIKKEDENALEKVMETFYKNIIPLLQEYFFGDYGKIGLILGSGFVKKKDDNEITFAKFEYDIETREMYVIINHRREPNSKQTFEEAIEILMNV